MSADVMQQYGNIIMTHKCATTALYMKKTHLAALTLGPLWPTVPWGPAGPCIGNMPLHNVATAEER